MDAPNEVPNKALNGRRGDARVGTQPRAARPQNLQ